MHNWIIGNLGRKVSEIKNRSKIKKLNRKNILGWVLLWDAWGSIDDRLIRGPRDDDAINRFRVRVRVRVRGQVQVHFYTVWSITRWLNNWCSSSLMFIYHDTLEFHTDIDDKNDTRRSDKCKLVMYLEEAKKSFLFRIFQKTYDANFQRSYIFRNKWLKPCQIYVLLALLRGECLQNGLQFRRRHEIWTGKLPIRMFFCCLYQ